MAGFHLCFKIMLPIGLVLIVLTIGSYFFVNNTLTKLIHKVKTMKKKFIEKIKIFLNI